LVPDKEYEKIELNEISEEAIIGVKEITTKSKVKEKKNVVGM
jgi:hypothetical protein